MLLDVATCFPTPIASPSPDDSYEVDMTYKHAASLAERLLINYEKQKVVVTKQEALEAATEAAKCSLSLPMMPLTVRPA